MRSMTQSSQSPTRLLISFLVQPPHRITLSSSSLGVSSALITFSWRLTHFSSVKLVRYIPSWLPGTSFQRYAKRISKTIEDMAQLPYDYAKKQIVCCFIYVPTLAPHNRDTLNRQMVLRRSPSFPASWKQILMMKLSLNGVLIPCTPVRSKPSTHSVFS